MYERMGMGYVFLGVIMQAKFIFMCLTALAYGFTSYCNPTLAPLSSEPGSSITKSKLSFSKTQQEEWDQVIYLAVQEGASQEDIRKIMQNLQKGPLAQTMPFTGPISRLIASESVPLESRRKMKEALDLFEALKFKMDVPDDVQLYINLGLDKDQKPVIAKGHCLYESGPRVVTIFPSFFNLCPSIIMFFMIHELWHAKQHEKQGIWKFMLTATNSGAVLETDADQTAAKAIRCKICLQMHAMLASVEDVINPTRLEQGYLSLARLSEFLNDKKSKDLCDAHKHDNLANQELVQLLSNSVILDQERFMLVNQADGKIGTLIDRLSTVSFE